MKYGTIKQEAAACRKAFKGVGEGTVVWFCHHGEPLEILINPPERRIKFILENKSKNEQAIRLHWFRPVDMTKMPKWLQKVGAERENAYAELQKAYAKWERACAEWEKTDAEWEKADARLERARAEWKKAYAKWERACAELEKTLQSHNINNLVKKHLPDCPWDGQGIV